jgi:hypothetical protein
MFGNYVRHTAVSTGWHADHRFIYFPKGARWNGERSPGSRASGNSEGGNTSSLRALGKNTPVIVSVHCQQLSNFRNETFRRHFRPQEFGLT